MHKVERAIIMAAGLGNRMHPITLTTPKPLVRVNGVRMIDTVIEGFLPIGRCCYCGWDNELEKCDRCGQLVDVDVLENGLCPSCSAYIDKQ